MIKVRYSKDNYFRNILLRRLILLRNVWYLIRFMVYGGKCNNNSWYILLHEIHDIEVRREDESS